MDALYKQLSRFVHGIQQSQTAVDLVEGPVNPEQLRALHCIAKHYHIRTRIHYKVRSQVSIWLWAGRALIMLGVTTLSCAHVLVTWLAAQRWQHLRPPVCVPAMLLPTIEAHLPCLFGSFFVHDQLSLHCRRSWTADKQMPCIRCFACSEPSLQMRMLSR